VVARTVMRGRQVAPFATYGPDGRVDQVFASRGRSFAASQTHWYRLADGRIVWHAATGTTSARPGSSAGSHPAPPSWSAPPLARRRLRRAGQPSSTLPPVRQ
jgi:hypothetical protein